MSKATICSDHCDLHNMVRKSVFDKFNDEIQFPV